MDLSIIIVSWNVRDLLEKCLDSIYKETKNISFETFVVDNASEDGTASMVQSKFPQVKLITNDKNLGFAKANNQAIKESKGDLILLLNPDTEIIDNALEIMVSFMRGRHLDIGIAGCKILNSDKGIQPSVRSFPTFRSQALVLLKLHNFLKTKSLKKYFALDFDYEKPQKVDQVMGAFFMIRRYVIKKIGLLDEKFYIWFEEVDYCKRAKEAGWEIFYLPVPEIIHHASQSFAQVLSFKKQRVFNKSLLYYFKKHHSFLARFGLLVLHPFSLLLSLVTQLLKIKK